LTYNQHQGQLSLPPLCGRYIEYWPVCLRLWWGTFTWVRWHVTLRSYMAGDAPQLLHGFPMKKYTI